VIVTSFVIEFIVCCYSGWLGIGQSHADMASLGDAELRFGLSPERLIERLSQK